MSMRQLYQYLACYIACLHIFLWWVGFPYLTSAQQHLAFTPTDRLNPAQTDRMTDLVQENPEHRATVDTIPLWQDRNITDVRGVFRIQPLQAIVRSNVFVTFERFYRHNQRSISFGLGVNFADPLTYIMVTSDSSERVRERTLDADDQRFVGHYAEFAYKTYSQPKYRRNYSAATFVGYLLTSRSLHTQSSINYEIPYDDPQYGEQCLKQSGSVFNVYNQMHFLVIFGKSYVFRSGFYLDAYLGFGTGYDWLNGGWVNRQNVCNTLESRTRGFVRLTTRAGFSIGWAIFRNNSGGISK
jgi:hypothetical protein